MANLSRRNEELLNTFRTVRVQDRDIEVYYEGPIESLADAKARGVYVYFSGVPCLRNHLSQRRTNNSACIVCELQKVKGTVGPAVAKMMTGPTEQEQFIKDLEAAGIKFKTAAEAPPVEAPPAKTAKKPAPKSVPEAFAKKDYSNSYIVKAICARTKKTYTVATMTEKACQTKGSEVPAQTVRQALAKLTKQGLIEILPASGREFIYRTHPEFFNFFSAYREKFAEYDPEHKERIYLNFDEALKLKDKAPEEVAAIQEEDALLAEIGTIEEADDMLLADAPTALIGRAIVDYIGKLRSNAEYDKAKARIDDLKRAVINYRTKYEESLAQTKRATVETNELKRENHDLRVKVSQLENLTQQLQGVINRGVRGTFSLREVAKIKNALGGLGLPDAMGGEQDASQH